MKRGTSRSFVLPVTAVCIGVAAGSILRMYCPAWDIWEELLFRQGLWVTDGSFGGLLFRCSAGVLFWTAVLAALGLSVVGTPAALAVMGLRGAAVGAVLAELYAGQGIRGVLAALLFVVPYALAETFLLLLAARETIRCTGQLRACLMGREDEPFSARLYALRFGILLFLMTGVALVQTVWMLYAYPFWNVGTNR